MCWEPRGVLAVVREPSPLPPLDLGCLQVFPGHLCISALEAQELELWGSVASSPDCLSRLASWRAVCENEPGKHGIFLCFGFFVLSLDKLTEKSEYFPILLFEIKIIFILP